ncbi:hypothetical protein GCM10009736_61840 [Actinomadura bangladeshensis]
MADAACDGTAAPIIIAAVQARPAQVRVSPDAVMLCPPRSCDRRRNRHWSRKVCIRLQRVHNLAHPRHPEWTAIWSRRTAIGREEVLVRYRRRAVPSVRGTGPRTAGQQVVGGASPFWIALANLRDASKEALMLPRWSAPSNER